MVEVCIAEWARKEPTGELAGLRLLNEQARETARTLARVRVLEIAELVDGIRVASYSYVGRLTIGDLTVTIEPKLEAGDLLTLVRYAYGLRDLQLYEPTWFGDGSRLLQDLLAAQLYEEVRELINRGLYRTYVPRRDWLASPRGRLDMIAIASQTEATTSLPCRHYPRSSNHLIHGVIISGLRLGAHVCSASALRRGLRRLASQLGHEAEAVRLESASIRAAWQSMNRLLVAYEPALRLVELLHSSRTASFEGDRDLSLPGFLFDMNRFFQALVARLLREHLRDCRVLEERSLRDMMRYVPGKNPRARKPPRPRPDFAVEHDGEVSLLDAKYRDLWETPLPRSMLYQLALYALSRRSRATAAIVYPTGSSVATEAVVEVSGAAGEGAAGYVALRPLIIPELAEAVRRKDTAALDRLARGVALSDRSTAKIS